MSSLSAEVVEHITALYLNAEGCTDPSPALRGAVRIVTRNSAPLPCGAAVAFLREDLQAREEIQAYARVLDGLGEPPSA